jgi:glycosyltransferase involved in cell wall biosynthesis
MKVYMNFGAVKSHHSLYDEMLSCPPEGVEYLTHGIDTKRIPGPIVSAYRFVKRFAGSFTSPLLRKGVTSTAPKADLVFFADHIEMSKDRFVCDFEHAWSLLPAGSVSGSLTKELFDRNRDAVQKTLKQDSCKGLIAWTKKGKQSVINAYGDGYPGLEEKITTIPLAMRIPQAHTPIEHDGFNLLFLGTSNLKGDWNFYYRGGVRMLRVFKRFSEGKKDVRLLITGDIPQSEMWRAKDLPIKIGGLLPKAELERAFRTSDALFYPSYTTPGLAFLEAMRYHLPIITTDIWANPETVSDKTGIVCPFRKFKKEGPYGILPVEEDFVSFDKGEVDEELEDSLVEALERLYSDRKLARSLGENGFREISEGRFSIARRNKSLLDTFTRALE